MQRPIEATLSVDVAFPLARAVLTANPERVLPVSPGSHSRMPVELGLGRGASLSEVVEVSFGTLTAVGRSLALPLCWRPVGHRLVAPAFDGLLELTAEPSATALRLVGRYKVLAGVGVGDRVARRSLQRLLGEIGQRLTSSAGSIDLTAAERTSEVDAEHPEMFLG